MAICDGLLAALVGEGFHLILPILLLVAQLFIFEAQVPNHEVTVCGRKRCDRGALAFEGGGLEDGAAFEVGGLGWRLSGYLELLQFEVSGVAYLLVLWLLSVSLLWRWVPSTRIATLSLQQPKLAQLT